MCFSAATHNHTTKTLAQGPGPGCGKSVGIQYASVTDTYTAPLSYIFLSYSVFLPSLLLKIANKKEAEVKQIGRNVQLRFFFLD